MRAARLLMAGLVAAVAVAPLALEMPSALAACKPQVDLWVNLSQPAAVHTGGSLTVAMRWGVHAVPGSGGAYAIVNDERWRAPWGTTATITSAYEKDPPVPYDDGPFPASISQNTASFEMDPGSEPGTQRHASITVRLAPSLAPGSSTWAQATIDTYLMYCGSDYRPFDNSSVSLRVAGQAKPTLTPKPSPKPTLPRSASSLGRPHERA